MTRVLVTGLGVVTGLGYTWEQFWDALVEGRSCIRAWQPGSDLDFPVKYAAPVDLEALKAAFAGETLFDEPMDRRTAFGVAAARQALLDAGLQLGQASDVGVVTGCGVPERDVNDMLLAIGDEGPDWRTFFRNRERRNTDFRQPNDRLAVLIARQNGAGGPVMNVSSACAGAAQAIGMAFRMVRRGEVDCMLAGGADSVLNLPTITGLHLLGAPSTSQRHGDRLCRPFDRQRSGLVAGEGAGMVFLESEARARARGATIYGEVVGYGSSLDAYGVTAPHPDGAGAVLAMSKALDDAGVCAQAIDCINAHGTSTFLNDPIETKAIKRVFAADDHYQNIAITANKSSFGHLIAAAGAPEFIATTLTTKFGIIPPTLNLCDPDPACDLDYVPHTARVRPVEYAMSNSFGFGGLNAALLVKRHGDD